MKLLPAQTDEGSLIAFGESARSLLMGHDYAGLASQFGYALACDRSPAAALEADFKRAIASPITVASGVTLPSEITVKYFSPNTTGLSAVVEIPLPVADNAAVLLELIVTELGDERHICVEDISTYRLG